MHPRSWAALAAFALAFSSPVTAQDTGFWASLGLGSGLQQLGCDICRSENNGGWAARAALGGTLHRRLRLGAEIHGWTDRTDDIRYTFYSVTPALYWHPAPERVPYFLFAGAGYASYRAADANEVMTSSGVGITFGAGYDLRLAGRYALTPFASYTASFLANLMYDRTRIADSHATLFQFGFGLTRR
jgi:hypothetical protein